MGYLEYCSECGQPNELQHVDGRQRRVCPNCGTVHYENPNPAATVIGIQGDQLLLVKRHSLLPAVTG
ncbi:MAG: NUDIX hydrolase [Armatimonadetes bacterium]|nr:NUDIX hydrolase [Armatimonadota bacterium]